MSHPDLDWQERARCQEVDSELFYPEQSGVPSASRSAKRVCMACEVRVACLNYALSHGERHGVWGGMTGPERRALARSAM